MPLNSKCVLFVLLASAVTQSVLADQVQLTSVKDNTLYFDVNGSLSNGSGDYLFMGNAGIGDVRRAVFAFDTSIIPAGSTINAVSLQLTIDQLPPVVFRRPGTANLHRLSASWGEAGSNAPGPEGQGTDACPNTIDGRMCENDFPGDATWVHRFFDIENWTSQGGDFIPMVSQTALFGTSPEVITFTSNASLVADVQSWVDDPLSNFGWIVRGDEVNERNARRMYSRECAAMTSFDCMELVDPQAPTLTIDFTPPSVVDSLTLNELATDLFATTSIANPGDGSGRLFIALQPGVIRVFDTQTQTLLPDPYLDIQDLVQSAGFQQGLLGLAFHPDFVNNQQFYVGYTRQPESGPSRSVIAQYLQSIGNPNLADPVSASVLMEFEQDTPEHNNADMHFGADGLLYIASGDGGPGGDGSDNSQNINSLKGKMLRIDVDGTPPRGGGELCGISPAYGIPEGNAFPGNDDGCDEILHIGLRNPWRFSFDAKTQEMFIGDVGQAEWEEVNLIAPGSPGLNFGWPCFEGTHVYNDGVSCSNPVDPIFEYSSNNATTTECAVTGGYVYRGGGTAIRGYYVYGDYCSGRIWIAQQVGSDWLSEEWPLAGPVLDSITTFGQDEKCELYIADADAGKLYKIGDSEILNRQGFEALRCR